MLTFFNVLTHSIKADTLERPIVHRGIPTIWLIPMFIHEVEVVGYVDEQLTKNIDTKLTPPKTPLMTWQYK